MLVYHTCYRLSSTFLNLFSIFFALAFRYLCRSLTSTRLSYHIYLSLSRLFSPFFTICHSLLLFAFHFLCFLCRLLFLLFLRKLHSAKSYMTMRSVPTPISTQPMSDFGVKLSCKNTNASTSVMTTLSLSTGTTFDASPIFKAL